MFDWVISERTGRQNLGVRIEFLVRGPVLGMPSALAKGTRLDGYVTPNEAKLKPSVHGSFYHTYLEEPNSAWSQSSQSFSMSSDNGRHVVFVGNIPYGMSFLSDWN